MSNSSAIIVKNLSKHYGSLKAVDNISFAVQQGEVFGILGPNGAGKTTTLEMLEGLREPTAGEITVLGLNVNVKHNLNQLKQKVGVQLQATSFFDYLTCLETLDLFASFYPQALDSQTLLKEVVLEQKANSYVTSLSGGQKQRLSLAMALVNNPEIVFLDEPTTGLDPQARRSLWDLVNSIKEKDKTVILTTHYMEEAEYLCDRVAIMNEGQIKDIDTPRALIQKLKAENKIEFNASEKLDLKEVKEAVEAIDANFIEGDIYSLTTKNPQHTINKLLDYAAQRSLKLDNLHISKPTLEDVFLAYTGKRLREE